MLKLQNIAYHCDSRSIIKECTVQAKPGEIVALLGPNGAGKSTLLELIGGMRQPTAGTITLDGMDITALSFKERAQKQLIGWLHQNTHRGVASDLTVRENIQLALLKKKHASLHIPQVDTNINTYISEKLGFESALFNEKVLTLSGGQRQLLAFLMTTLIPSKVLLLDEPTAALDIAATNKLYHMIKEYAQRTKPLVLFITHDLKEAVAVATQFWILSKGRIIKIIPAGEFDPALYEQWIGQQFSI